jgi:hypothetical protein
LKVCIFNGSLMLSLALIGTIHLPFTEAIYRITGAYPAYTRPRALFPDLHPPFTISRPSPITAAFGEYNQLVQEVAGLRGQTLANWDFDSRDAAGATGDQSLRSYNSLIASRPASILTLNHEITPSTPRILPDVIRDLQAAGYRLTTLADCLGEPAYQWVDEPQERTVSLGIFLLLSGVMTDW